MMTEQRENRYHQPWKDSDIVLVLKDPKDESKTEEYHCHSTILTLNSPVFESMFKEDTFKEGREKRATLTGKERDAFILFLDMMYPPTQSTQVSLGKRKMTSRRGGSDLKSLSDRSTPRAIPFSSTGMVVLTDVVKGPQSGSREKRSRVDRRSETSNDGVEPDDNDERNNGKEYGDEREQSSSSSASSPNGRQDKSPKKDALKLFSTVLDYANEYLVECVRLRVDQLLSLEVHSRITGYEEPKRDLKTCFEVLLVADRYKLNRLKAACLSYIWMSDDNFLYEETCAKRLSPETQCILMKLEINKLGIADRREKRVGRERSAPLTIEISDTVQRNLINLSEYHDADFFYNNRDYLMNLSVFETHHDSS